MKYSHEINRCLYAAGFGLLLMLQALNAAADTIIETRSLSLQFNGRGDLSRVEACYPDCTAAHAKTRVLSSRRGMLVFAAQSGNDLQVKQRHEDTVTVLDFSNAMGEVLRHWIIPDEGWQISLRFTAAQTANLMAGVEFRPTPASGFAYLLEQIRYLFFDGGGVHIAGLDDEDTDSREAGDWFGFRNRFWTAMVKPGEVEPGQAWSVTPETGETLADAGIAIKLPADAPQSLDLYLGPVEPGALAQAAPELETLMYAGLWFWLRWICQGLYFLLSAIQSVIPNWALAVMVMSLLVNVLMRPLSKIAEHLQDQVQRTDARLRPLLADIKKNFKGAQQSEKILALYKSEGVHPLYSLKSLAGVAVVIPIFIGAFDMLAENIHLSGETFLWIADLSHPDAFWELPFSLPFFGRHLNLLPFIMTGFSFVASKLHYHPALDSVQQRRQARNLVLMSLGFLLLFYTFPAGMVLYWTSNNLISVFRMLWQRRTREPVC